MFLSGFRGLLGSTYLQRAIKDDAQYKLLVKNDFYKNRICTNYLPWRYMLFFKLNSIAFYAREIIIKKVTLQKLFIDHYDPSEL